MSSIFQFFCYYYVDFYDFMLGKHTVDDQIQADRPSVEKRLVKTLASQQVSYYSNTQMN